MPYSNTGSNDFEKLQKAFAEIAYKFGSLDHLLESFGLAHMPPAQRYGIMFGIAVFCFTVTAVVTLLIVGGSFKRIAEQAQTGEATLLSAAEARAQRALLMERLLEGRERMSRNYPEPPKTTELTSLTKMLLNVAPKRIVLSDGKELEVSALVDEAEINDKKMQEIRRYVPPYYEENYISAYRKCQDRPGGPILSGRPEARFEAYARGFAGCGPYTGITYRRSYGRMYEAICCATHATEEKHSQIFKTRPEDIIGKYVHLEALQVDRHLQDLYQVTSGQPALESKGYDPDEVWGFQEDGPFDNAEEMAKSFVFQRRPNEASFAIVHSVTDRVMGAVLLLHDDPKHLTIQLEPPLMQPGRDGSREQLECCFLLMDRLFGYGYRRIQFCIDSQDATMRKLATRLGFTLEGILYKHMIQKEANRDSNLYALLNSDWQRGARSAIFKKLYGDAALRIDGANEKKEEEFDEQERVLKEKKRLDAEASKIQKLS